MTRRNDIRGLHMSQDRTEQMVARQEGYRRVVRHWLWGHDIHMTLFVYSHEAIWVWIMCSSYLYRLRKTVPGDRWARCAFVLEAHRRLSWQYHEYLEIIPVSSTLKDKIDEVLA